MVGIRRFLAYVAFAIITFQILLRLFVNGDVASFAQNTLINTLIWAGVSVWLLSIIVKGNLTLRLSGLEIPLLIFTILCAYSVKVGVQKQPAALYAFSYISFILLFLFI